MILEPPFPAWESFYVIVGSSAGALTGLQFVVMALIADSSRNPTSDTVSTFGTPTIVHFCAVLILSAILSAPWPTLTGPSWLLGAAGAVGLVYVGTITLGAGHQSGYKPVLEDWVFHSILPGVAYALLFAGGLLMISRTTAALFMIATMAVLLLVVGIHNAWDTVTFIVVAGTTPHSNRAADTAATTSAAKK
jgi:hypothetical protein